MKSCEQSSCKTFWIKMPTVVFLVSVFVFLTNPHLSASIPLGSNYGSAASPYWQSISHPNSLIESNLNDFNRVHLNRPKPQLYSGHNIRFDPLLSFLAQMETTGKGGQARFPKDYLEFLLPANSNGNPTNPANNPGANPAKLFNHPNEVAELSPIDAEQDDSQPSSYEASLSSHNHLGGQTKRNSGGGGWLRPQGQSDDMLQKTGFPQPVLRIEIGGKVVGKNWLGETSFLEHVVTLPPRGVAMGPIKAS